MPNKLLVVDYPSFVEKGILKHVEVSTTIHDADIIVNPTYGTVVGKTIIVNLPVDIPIDKLSHYNKVISRFPISTDIQVELYRLPEVRKDITKDDVSCLILSKDLVNDPKYMELVHNGKFIIGTDVEIDGGLTLVGYLLLRYKIETLSPLKSPRRKHRKKSK